MSIRLPNPAGRMTPARKADLVRAIRLGELPRAEALTRYGLSTEELDGWERLYLEHGQGALRVTRIQQFREVSRG